MDTQPRMPVNAANSGRRRDHGSRTEHAVAADAAPCMLPDYTIHVETILADHDLVAVFGSASGTYNGKGGPVLENRIEMPAAWRAVVQNGKVKRWQVYADWTKGPRTIAEDNAVG